MLPIIGYGAGGHSRVLLDMILLRGEFEIVGLIDDSVALHGQQINGSSVLGGRSLLPGLIERGIRHIFLGLGGVGDNRPRARAFAELCSLGFQIVNVIHPAAVISKSVLLGNGIAVMAGAVINCGSQIGDNVIVNTGSVIDHDCRIADHVHIAPGAVLSGGVNVGAYSHLGTGARVRQSVTIGSGVIVGVGSAVVADVPDNCTVVGVPAKPLRQHSGTLPLPVSS